MSLGVMNLNSDGSIAVRDYTTRPPATSVWGADHCLVDEDWAKLRTYLSDRPSSVARLVLSIAEVEHIIDRRLPDDAALQGWWSRCPRLVDATRDERWHFNGMPGHYLIEFARG